MGNDRRTTPSQKTVIAVKEQWVPVCADAGYPQAATSYFRLAIFDPDKHWHARLHLAGGGLNGPERYATRDLPESVQARQRRIGRAITGKLWSSEA